jgi:2-oxo-4-hydroxy-4-carboxy-5-ureidoimidazoline decarboxylase
MEPWQTLDSASAGDARRLLSTCCGSTRWVEGMMKQRPFGSQSALNAWAQLVWDGLSRPDWLEAFSHHPKIGDRAALRAKFAATRHLSEQEQSGVDSASDDVLDALAAGNRDYEQKFGYIFIVCATGKGAGEMLALLRERLQNTPEHEIAVARAEQLKIMWIRLSRLTESRP